MEYDAFPSLGIERPEDGLLVITLQAEGRLNAIDASAHGQLAAIWQEIDKDRDIRAVVVRGAGGNFSAGGDFELIDEKGDAVPDSLTLPKAVFVDIWTRLRDELLSSGAARAHP